MKILNCFIVGLILASSTLCRAQSNIKWEETFPIAGQFPDGWQIINNDNSPINPWQGFAEWFFSPGLTDSEGNLVVQPHAGALFVVSSFLHANADGLIDEWLISPQVEGIETGDSLHFYAGAPDTDFKDSLRVFISTSGNDLGSFTNQIAWFKIDGPKGVYHKYSFDLSDFAGENIYFAVNFFIVNGNSNGNQPYVDHFIITGDSPTSVSAGNMIDNFSLTQNYPNPFNPATTITFTMGQTSDFSLTVYDILGNKVRTLLQGKTSSGVYSVVWDGKNAFGRQVASGQYFYKIDAGEFQSTKKMLLLK